MTSTPLFAVQSTLENKSQPMVRQKEADLLIDFFGHPESIVATNPNSTCITTAKISSPNPTAKTSLPILQPIFKNSSQPVMRPQDATDVIKVIFAHAQPIVSQQPKSTREAKPQTSARGSKSTRITISQIDLNDSIYSISKPEKAPVHQIICLLTFLVLFALFFVLLKHISYNEVVIPSGPIIE